MYANVVMSKVTSWPVQNKLQALYDYGVIFHLILSLTAIIFAAIVIYNVTTEAAILSYN